MPRYALFYKKSSCVPTTFHILGENPPSRVQCLLTLLPYERLEVQVGLNPMQLTLHFEASSKLMLQNHKLKEKTDIYPQRRDTAPDANKVW